MLEIRGFIARRKRDDDVGPSGKVIGIEAFPAFADDLESAGCDRIGGHRRARDPLAVRDVVWRSRSSWHELGAFLPNVPGVELAAILAYRQRGKVYYLR